MKKVIYRLKLLGCAACLFLSLHLNAKTSAFIGVEENFIKTNLIDHKLIQYDYTNCLTGGLIFLHSLDTKTDLLIASSFNSKVVLKLDLGISRHLNDNYSAQFTFNTLSVMSTVTNLVDTIPGLGIGLGLRTKIADRTFILINYSVIYFKTSFKYISQDSPKLKGSVDENKIILGIGYDLD